MNRVILLRQYESKRGIQYKGDYLDISLWKRHEFVKPTGLALTKKDSMSFFKRYCEYFAQSLEVHDLPNNLLLAFMYCHAAHICGCSLDMVHQIILEFDDDAVDVFCLMNKKCFFS